MHYSAERGHWHQGILFPCCVLSLQKCFCRWLGWCGSKHGNTPMKHFHLVSWAVCQFNYLASACHANIIRPWRLMHCLVWLNALSTAPRNKSFPGAQQLQARPAQVTINLDKVNVALFKSLLQTVCQINVALTLHWHVTMTSMTVPIRYTFLWAFAWRPKG